MNRRHRMQIYGLIAALGVIVPLAGCESGMPPQEFSGKGSENTPAFDAAADWIVEWEHSKSQQARAAVLFVGPINEVFAVSIYREGAKGADDFLAIACPPGGPTRGEYRVKESGRFYLGIVALHDVRWTVKVAPAP